MSAALVVRLRPRRPAWQRPALIGAGVLGVTGVAGLVLAEIVTAVSASWPVTLVLSLAGVPVAWRVCHRSQKTCTGLHCSGCRHH